MRFEFATAARILFGAGALAEAAALATGLGGRHALLLADPSTGHVLAARVHALATDLAQAGLAVTRHDVSGEPSTDSVLAAAAVARGAGCDIVLSLGGGSVIDSGKAVAALLTNDGNLFDYLEVIGRGRTLVHRPAPHLAIPTTAGTGAEVTRNAVLASPAHGVKVSMRSPLMLPTVAIVDPLLTHSMPPGVTASTGLDALTQLLEAFTCNAPNPLTDGFCREGMARAARSLRRAFEQGDDAAAREDMALASLLGGLALANARLGAVHGFAGPLGGRLGAAHGAVCAALLPHVVAANVRALGERAPVAACVLSIAGSTTPCVPTAARTATASAPSATGTTTLALARYDEAARILTERPTARAREAVAWLRDLCAALAVPSLGTLGLRECDEAEILAQARAASSMKGNPVALSAEELTQVLRAAREG